jgi:predicted RNase H-like nuclease
VALADGRFAEAALLPSVAAALARWPDARVIGIDIPIGLSGPFPRAADVLARRRLGPHRSSVFPTMPREVLEAPSYRAAVARSVERFGRGLSRQAYALRARILEVDALAAAEPRLVEVHPEVSFRAMAPSVQRWFPKRTWNGQAQRRACLRSVGIVLPEDLGQAGLAGPDDVLDAAAAAWSAHRVARGQAGTLPEVPDRDELGRPIAIHY